VKFKSDAQRRAAFRNMNRFSIGDDKVETVNHSNDEGFSDDIFIQSTLPSVDRPMTDKEIKSIPRRPWPKSKEWVDIDFTIPYNMPGGWDTAVVPYKLPSGWDIDFESYKVPLESYSQRKEVFSRINNRFSLFRGDNKFGKGSGPAYYDGDYEILPITRETFIRSVGELLPIYAEVKKESPQVDYVPVLEDEIIEPKKVYVKSPEAAELNRVRSLERYYKIRDDPILYENMLKKQRENYNKRNIERLDSLKDLSNVGDFDEV
jgi:hypothetical protein